MKILVTGGAGYIGSHTVVELISSGHEVVIVDNFSNSNAKVLERLKTITGRSVICEKLDLCNRISLQKVFDTHNFDAVIHFAGLKAVGESVALPLMYYHNNLVSTLNLCAVMSENNVKRLVFSSSATVYGDPDSVPIAETAPLHATNPYGQTKLMIEQILQDLVNAGGGWRITCLRYFNPIGAHESGLIGEDPTGIPNNLLPYVSQVAVGKREYLQIFGNDYLTKDGTGVRDYIHVVDLANGHVAALEHPPKTGTCLAINLGTGTGYSVLEVVKAFESVSGKEIPYKIMPRRLGDIATCYANAAKANKELHWKATKTIQQACADAWRWQSNNPNGYS